MLRILTGALAVLLVTSVQSALSRLMPSALPVLLPPALVAGAVLTLPYRPALRLMLIAACAAELGSGLPTGGVGVALVACGHLLFGAVRRARLVLPLLLQGLAGACLTALVLVGLTVAFDRSPLGLGPLAGLYILERVVAPSAISGLVTVGVVVVLRRGAGQALLRTLGSQST